MRHGEVLLLATLPTSGVHLEERHSMQRLLSDTDEVAPHAGVDDPLLGDHRQVSVHLEDSSTRGHHDGLLPGPVQVAVDEMFLKSIQGDVQHLEEVSLSSS